MASSSADRFSAREVLRHFIKTLPVSLDALDQAVREVIDSSGDEPARRRAHEMAEAFVEASASSGLSDLAAILRAIASLLKLRLEDTLTVAQDIRQKLTDLLGMLKEVRGRALNSALG